MIWTLLLSRCGSILAVAALHQQEGLMHNITTIGLDLAKHVGFRYMERSPSQFRTNRQPRRIDFKGVLSENGTRSTLQEDDFKHATRCARERRSL